MLNRRQAGGKIPGRLDGGFRRGTDVFKAAVGRAYLWSLAAFGQRAVPWVMELLRPELAVDMSMASRFSDIDRGFVRISK